MVYSTRRFFLCLALCYFVLVFFRPFSTAIISLGEERAYLSAFCTFVRFAHVWFCLFALRRGVLEGVLLVIGNCGTPWTFLLHFFGVQESKQGPVVQSIVSVTSSLMVSYVEFVLLLFVPHPFFFRCLGTLKTLMSYLQL